MWGTPWTLCETPCQLQTKFEKCIKIFECLTPFAQNYEVLHTQGENYIIPLLSERIEKV
jgi:hypothetical protein